MVDYREMTPRQVVIYLIALFVAFLLALYLLVAAYSCGCPRIARSNAVHSYNADHSGCSFTPMGACVITNNNVVSDSYYLIIDDKITATESCLKSWYAERDDALHRVYNWKAPARSCYTVLLPDDWRVACEDPEQQVYGHAPQEACDAKGFEADLNCPCGWRTSLQSGNVIVTTPNLYMFRQSVVELLTGYAPYYAWQDKSLIPCMGF